MLFSRDKFKFVNNYIKSYENTIKALNKNGDFSEAKMFESFAKKICEFIFDEDFKDLNTYEPNYPYVDLVSEKSNLFVQVSTQNDIPKKIEKTLTKISKSKKEDFKKIKRVIFFVLNNDSIQNVKSFIGKNKIGNISFYSKRDVISTATLIKKCDDSVFLDKIYKLVYDDFISYFTCFERYNDAIESSKSRIKLIKSVLGDSSNNIELDREELLNKIASSPSKFNIVTGVAGSGKSSLCKKLCLNNENYIYLRAECFNSSKTITDSFGFSLNTILPLLSDDLLIFIDSLEFVIDVQEKHELLFELFDVVNKFENVKVVLSCRTSDLNSFSRILNFFDVSLFDVPLLNVEDIKKIIKKFPNLVKFYNKKNYKDIFLNLLYLDILIENSSLFSPDLNETSFRKEIFKNVICLENRLKTLQLKRKDVQDTILNIVMDRAKKYVITLDRDDYDDDIINALVSNNIILEKDGYIRLKYDMFEDICFEHIMDKIYNESKDNLPCFFSRLEDIGKSVHRRFQNWLSEKMVDDNIGFKIAYSVLFQNSIKSDWMRHTIVGLCNSDCCNHFFDLYSHTLTEDMILKMIEAVNLYCHKVNRTATFSNKAFILTKPNGFGRGELIKLIYSKKMYESSNAEKIIKLCIDYTKGFYLNSDVSEITAKILEYYFSFFCRDVDSFKLNKTLLGAIYSLSAFSRQWILNLWETIKTNYLENSENKYLASEIFNYTILAFNYYYLIDLKEELLKLVNVFWLNVPKKNNFYYPYEIDYKEKGPIFLNDHTDNFFTRNLKPLESTFIYILFISDFKSGVDWIVDFLNKLILKSIEKGFSYNKIKLINGKEYYFNSDFALYGFTNFSDCYFLDNLIYPIVKAIENLDNLEENLEYLKNKVFSVSNNGLLFETLVFSSTKVKKDNDILLCNELCSSCEFLYADSIRFSKLNPSYTQQYLFKAIEKQVGIPLSENKYKLDSFPTLAEMFLKYGMENFSGPSNEIYENILKYLEQNYGNAWKNFIDSLDRNNYENKKQDDVHNKPLNPIDKIINDFKTNGPSLQRYEQLIGVYESCDDNSKILFQEFYVISLAGILSLPNLEKTLMESYCSKLLNFCEEALFGKGTFIGNGLILKPLFSQINTLSNRCLANRIYDFALKCILSNEASTGVIREIVQAISIFVSETKDERIFNTIINLAIDEADEQKWFYDQIISKGLIDDQEYIQNVSKKLVLNKAIIEHDNLAGFNSKKEQIIKDILHEGKLNWEYEQYNKAFDLNIALRAFTLNINMTNQHMIFVFKKVFDYLLMINSYKESHKIDLYDSYSFEFEDYVKHFIKQESNDFKKCTDIMIECLSTYGYSDKIFDLFDSSFDSLSSSYFDAFSDKHIRNSVQDKIKYLELTLKKNIENKKISDCFYKTLILWPGRYLKWEAWDDCKTEYNYSDKMFLINLYEKYGQYDINRFLKSIYMLKYEKMMPEIVKPMSSVLSNLDTNNKAVLTEAISNHSFTLIQFISEAYCNHRAEIKSKDELCCCFEKLLNILISYGLNEAAVLLIEFQVL